MLFNLIDWIDSTKRGTKAYCKWCKLELNPKISTLKRHSYSERHKCASPVPNNHNSQFRMETTFKNQHNNFLKVNKCQTEVRLALQQALHGNMNKGNHLIDENTWIRTFNGNAKM